MASLGTGPAERLAAAPRQSPSAQIAPLLGPQTQGKRLELGDLEESGQPRVRGIHTLILPKQAFLGAEAETAL